MEKQFKAVLFDLGETLRILKKDEEYQKKAIEKLAELAGTDMDPQEFFKFMNYRYEGYRKWAFEEMRETNEEELWVKWLLPDYPREHVIKNAVALSFEYRQCTGYRVLVDGGREVIQTLKERGYKLGIISNLITTYEVPDWLKEDNLGQYFDTVVLSAVCGLRKPDPEIYRLAAREIGVDPSECAYVGDNFNRDVTGSKAAGFGMNIIFTSEKKLEKQMASVSDANRPDGVVFDFLEILNVFPQAPQADVTQLRAI